MVKFRPPSQSLQKFNIDIDKEGEGCYNMDLPNNINVFMFFVFLLFTTEENHNFGTDIVTYTWAHSQHHTKNLKIYMIKYLSSSYFVCVCVGGKGWIERWQDIFTAKILPCQTWLVYSWKVAMLKIENRRQEHNQEFVCNWLKKCKVL